MEPRFWVCGPINAAPDVGLCDSKELFFRRLSSLPLAGKVALGGQQLVMDCQLDGWDRWGEPGGAWPLRSLFLSQVSGTRCIKTSRQAEFGLNHTHKTFSWGVTLLSFPHSSPFPPPYILTSHSVCSLEPARASHSTYLTPLRRVPSCHQRPSRIKESATKSTWTAAVSIKLSVSSLTVEAGSATQRRAAPSGFP